MSQDIGPGAPVPRQHRDRRHAGGPARLLPRAGQRHHEPVLGGRGRRAGHRPAHRLRPSARRQNGQRPPLRVGPRPSRRSPAPSSTATARRSRPQHAESPTTTPAPTKRPSADPATAHDHHHPRSAPAPAATSSCCCCCWPSASCSSPTLNVGLAMNGAFPPDMLSYGAGLLGIAGAFHLVLRWQGVVRRPGAAADRDPAQRPGPGDDPPPRPGPQTAPAWTPWRSSSWSGARSSVVIAAAVIIGCVKDHRRAAALHLHRHGGRPGAAAAAAGARAWAAACSGSRIWIGLGPFTFQPGEVAKILLAIFFAGYLVTDPRRALARRAPRSWASRCPGPATSARSSSPGWPAWVSSSSSTTSAPRCSSSACSSPCCTSPPSGDSWIVIGLVLFCGGAYLALPDVRSRPGARRLWLHAVRPQRATSRSAAATSWSRA